MTRPRIVLLFSEEIIRVYAIRLLTRSVLFLEVRVRVHFLFYFYRAPLFFSNVLAVGGF